jgi:hypothetical protein
VRIDNNMPKYRIYFTRTETINGEIVLEAENKEELIKNFDENDENLCTDKDLVENPQITYSLITFDEDEIEEV